MEGIPATTTPPAPAAPAFPLTFSVDYPEGNRNRLTAFFRIFMVIPIAIVIGLLTSMTFTYNHSRTYLSANAFWHSGWTTWSVPAGTWHMVYSTGGILFLATLVMILFRQKYPRWWFDWTLALSKFSARVGSYFGLLRDEYPSTDEEQAVHLDFQYPDVKKDLNRWLPLVKWFLAIPHYVVLFFLAIGVLVVCIIAWFAILFTGKYPRSMFDFVVGFGRWGWRVEAYSILLITDKYPPFSLGE